MKDTILEICYFIFLLFSIALYFIVMFFVNKQQNKLIKLEERIQQLEADEFQKELDDYIEEKLEEHTKIKNN